MARTTSILGVYPTREAEAFFFFFFFWIIEAEALCMKEVLSWLKERQLDTCIIETDSMQVIEAQNTSSQNSMFHLIIDILCKLLKLSIPLIKILCFF